jgi:4-alpha-glucanotransferase
LPRPHLPRSSGILLHISSLPGRFGIGDLGPAAWRFVDLLARLKQTWWQMLPLGPPAIAGCPYQCFSAMAGDPNLISPELLRQEGLITPHDLSGAQGDNEHVDFAAVTAMKCGLLSRAWEHFQGGAAPHLKLEFEEFRNAEAKWLGDFSLFMALRHAHGSRPWADWPRAMAFRKPVALRAARRELAEPIAQCEFAQFLFFRQLAGLRMHAARAGIKLIGDMPIFVAGESADVWSNPGQFQLDRDRRPKFVAGVPPDYFSKTGQRWGNPLYRWSAMKRDGFRWWIARAAMALRQTDLVRIDHFRGLAACWSIPASAPTAELGRWVKSPGRQLLEVLQREFTSHVRPAHTGDGKTPAHLRGQDMGRPPIPRPSGLPFIAEDLGMITPDVEKLRDDFNLPGMRVLQFAFGGDAGNPFLPHNYPRNCIAYTGTHDNDTSAGWYKSLDPKTQKHVNDFTLGAARDPAAAFIRLAWSSVADVAIAPLQDVLGLGSEARMNTPGLALGNWGWRVSKAALGSRRFNLLQELTAIYAREAANP